MKGHFKKRGEKWYFWAELDPGDGKRRQVSRSGFRTRREAEAGFAVYRDEVRRGGHVDTSKVRVQEYLVDEWLPAIKASVKESTHAHTGATFASTWCRDWGHSGCRRCRPLR